MCPQVTVFTQGVQLGMAFHGLPTILIIEQWNGQGFLNICFIFNYVYVCVDICTQKLELGNALKMELQRVASCPTWVLGTELSCFNHLAISLALPALF